jgi:hypothetical protein
VLNKRCIRISYPNERKKKKILDFGPIGVALSRKRKNNKTGEGLELEFKGMLPCRCVFQFDLSRTFGHDVTKNGPLTLTPDGGSG